MWAVKACCEPVEGSGDQKQLEAGHQRGKKCCQCQKTRNKCLMGQRLQQHPGAEWQLSLSFRKTKTNNNQTPGLLSGLVKRTPES